MQQVISYLSCLFHGAGTFTEWVTASATVGAVVVAAVQLRAIRATDRANLPYQLNQDFFKPEARRIIRLLDKDNVVFDENKSAGQFLVNSQAVFDSYELDDYILGPLETVAAFEDQDAVDIEMVYAMFDWYIEIALKSEAVQSYIKWQRTQPNGFDVYLGLENLYVKCCRIASRSYVRLATPKRTPP